jgi:hypothetical protein
VLDGTWGDPRLPDRIWAKIYVCPITGCWLSTYALGRDGYTQVRPPGGGLVRMTHTVVFEALVGPVPPGLQLDHLCRVRCCCNPDHLEPVTGRENLLRGNTFQAANVAKTHCPQGHPYDAVNTMMVGKNKTNRACRECYRQAWRRRYGKHSPTPVTV